MSKVKGSPQFRSIVVRDEPGRRARTVVLWLITVVAVAVASTLLGSSAVYKQLLAVEQERDQLSEALLKSELARQHSEQQLTNLSTGAEMDRQAVDEVRATIKEQKQQIAALSEEIGFYKGLMSPTDRERGLSIRGWEVYPTGSAQRFHYKLLIQQLAVKHRVLRGSVSVVITGRENGVEKSINLADLSKDVSSRNMPLRFKYFQNIEGELELPADFVPQRVGLVAKATTPKKVQVEKHYGWIVQ